MDNSIELILEDMPIKVNPDNIIRVLEANQGVPSVTFMNCSAAQLLAFLLEMQNIAVDTHIVKSGNNV